jgi:hypothetical protein
MTVRWGARLGIAAAAILLFGACGQKADVHEASGAGADVQAVAADGSSAHPTEVPAQSTTPTTVVKAPAAKTTASTLGGPVPPGGTPLRAAAAPDPAQADVPLPLDVQAPPCVRAGSDMPVTLTTEPDVDIAMIVQFSDRRSSDGAQALGTTDANGRYSTRLVIPPTAPLGEAKLYVAAGAGRRGATREHVFQIVSATGSCQ